MVKIGYHASHEQFKPSELLNYVQQAEQAGLHLSLSSEINPYNVNREQQPFIQVFGQDLIPILTA